MINSDLYHNYLIRKSWYLNTDFIPITIISADNKNDYSRS